MMSFKYQLYHKSGNHKWKLNKTTSTFTDSDKEEYVVCTCKKCGMTARKYPDVDSTVLFIGCQYPHPAVYDCPGELGLIDGPIDGSLSIALGDDTIKKKKKKCKMIRTKWPKSMKMVRTKWPDKVTKMKRTR